MASHLAKVPLGYVVSAGSGALKKVIFDDVRALHAFVADVGRAVAMVVGIGGLATPGFAARLPRRIELPCARNALPGGVEARNRCRLVGVMVITDTCMGAA